MNVADFILEERLRKAREVRDELRKDHAEKDPDADWDEFCEIADNPGVYGIVCLVNRRWCIGCSRSSMLRRINTHVRQLGDGEHPKRDLQADYDQYESEAGLFWITIHAVTTPGQALAAEHREMTAKLWEGYELYNKWPPTRRDKSFSSDP